jgi:hypothetical protein
MYFVFPTHGGFAGMLADVVEDCFGRLGELLSIFLVFVTPPMLVVIGTWSVLGRGKAAHILSNETRCRKCGYILRGIPEPRCSECGEKI